VVHIITRLELGGAQQNTLTTCRALARAGYRVALVFGPGGELDRDLHTLDGVELRPIRTLVRSIHPARDARAVPAVRSVLAELLAEHDRREGSRHRFIVHTHSSKAGIVGRTAAASLGLTNIIHSIHGFPFHVGQPAPIFEAYVAAERAMARVTRAFIAVSRANVAEAQARRIIGPNHRVEVIRSGMSLDAFRREAHRRTENRSRMGIEADRPVFAAIANLKPQKDPLTAVETMRYVVDGISDARLLYVGDGPLRPRVEARIRELDLEATVTLLGWRRDVPQVMAAADVIVLSSRFEGLPRSAVQAVAVGRPFVGNRVDGTPEIIRAARDGFLVEPGRPSDLARAMIRAYRERPVAADAEARLRAWSDTVLVDRQRALYEELTE
jgi:glycosyltransferase involved in cell wall biosynthesis